MDAVTTETEFSREKPASVIAEPRPDGFWSWLTPAAVAAIVLAATLGVWDHVRTQEMDTARARFDRYAGNVAAAISERLTGYEQLLRGADGLFQSSKDVDRIAWRDYVQSLRIDDNFPRLQALGFARHLTASGLASHIEATRAEGFPDYAVWPRGDRTEFAVVDYLEPFSGRNLRAFGYDMLAEPALRAALERARDNGDSSLSNRPILVRGDAGRRHAGFQLFLPVYRDSLPTRTISQRRIALQGYVFGAFSMDELVRGTALEQANDILLKAPNT